MNRIKRWWRTWQWVCLAHGHVYSFSERLAFGQEYRCLACGRRRTVATNLEETW